MKRLTTRKFILISIALLMLTIQMQKGSDISSSLLSILLAVIGL